MKAMILIADHSCGYTVQDILVEENIACRFLMHAHGSVDSAILDYLGLGENKKVMAFSFVPDNKVMHLYEVFNNKLSLTEAGKGIAFTIPVSGASGTAFSLGGTSPEKEEITKMSDVKYELIVTIVNRGGFEKVKEAAKRAGARGGTLIHGLGLGGEEAAKFLGISIQPEKDVVLIVVGKDEREQVMQKIMEEAGILTENRGICFSLPVDTALGLAGKTGSIEDMVK
jgi:nitrogen regulatory protein PII